MNNENKILCYLFAGFIWGLFQKTKYYPESKSPIKYKFNWKSWHFERGRYCHCKKNPAGTRIRTWWEWERN